MQLQFSKQSFLDKKKRNTQSFLIWPLINS